MSKLQQKSDSLSFEKVWLMFQDTDKKFRDTDKKFQDTDKKFQDTDKKFQDTDKKFQKTKELLDKSSIETDRKFQETNKKFQETEKILRDLSTKMSESESRWSKFVESLVEGDLILLLQSRGIVVHALTNNMDAFYNSKWYEYDLIAFNDTDVVVLEVKTTLRDKYIKTFLEKLEFFKKALPKFSRDKIYGAMAFIKSPKNIEQNAQNQGLFTIKATGKSAHITNDQNFKPKAW